MITGVRIEDLTGAYDLHCERRFLRSSGVSTTPRCCKNFGETLFARMLELLASPINAVPYVGPARLAHLFLRA